MHTVVETPSILVAAKKAGMSGEERANAVTIVASNPEAGDRVAGAGGVCKIRVPSRGKGKSGGYRVLTYFLTEDEPVFLISVLNKSKQANLSSTQKGEIKVVAKEIRDER